MSCSFLSCCVIIYSRCVSKNLRFSGILDHDQTKSVSLLQEQVVLLATVKYVSLLDSCTVPLVVMSFDCHVLGISRHRFYFGIFQCIFKYCMLHEEMFHLVCNFFWSTPNIIFIRVHRTKVQKCNCDVCICLAYEHVLLQKFPCPVE